MARQIGSKPRPVEEAADAAILRSGQAKRLKNLTELEEMTGFPRDTISAWTRKGLRKSGTGPRGAVLIDVRNLIDFITEEARADERRKVEKERPVAPPTPAVPDGGFVDWEMELVKEQILAQKVRTAERVGILVTHRMILESHAVILNGFQVAYESISERVSRVLVGHNVAIVRAVKAEVKTASRDALISAEKAMDRDYLRITKDVLARYDIQPDATFDVEHDDVEEEIDEEDPDADLSEEEEADAEE